MNTFLQMLTLMLFFLGLASFVVAGWLLSPILGWFVLGAVLTLSAFIVSPTGIKR